jgi:RHS repeat-associated protein
MTHFGACSFSVALRDRYKFIGKERDSESGLDNFGARYFTSSMGRFMSPDWAARPTTVPYAVFGDPQTLNLYGYVRNNPLARADLDGHSWWDKLKNWVGDAQCWCEGEAAKQAIARQRQLEQARKQAYESAKAAWEKKHPGRSYAMYRLNIDLELAGFGPMAGFSVVGEGAEGVIEAGSAAARIWPSMAHGPRVINGIEYTTEALYRMAPAGMGRGVPPSVVENAIQYGSKALGNKPDTVVHTFENVTVVTNSAANKVITVIKTGH